jgi:hypothetical protein
MLTCDVTCRRKHGMPMVADDKAKVVKKKNLQVLILKLHSFETS